MSPSFGAPLATFGGTPRNVAVIKRTVTRIDSASPSPVAPQWPSWRRTIDEGGPVLDRLRIKHDDIGLSARLESSHALGRLGHLFETPGRHQRHPANPPTHRDLYESGSGECMPGAGRNDRSLSLKAPMARRMTRCTMPK